MYDIQIPDTTNCAFIAIAIGGVIAAAYATQQLNTNFAGQPDMPEQSQEHRDRLRALQISGAVVAVSAGGFLLNRNVIQPILDLPVETVLRTPGGAFSETYRIPLRTVISNGSRQFIQSLRDYIFSNARPNMALGEQPVLDTGLTISGPGGMEMDIPLSMADAASAQSAGVMARAEAVSAAIANGQISTLQTPTVFESQATYRIFGQAITMPVRNSLLNAGRILSATDQVMRQYSLRLIDRYLLPIVLAGSAGAGFQLGRAFEAQEAPAPDGMIEELPIDDATVEAALAVDTQSAIVHPPGQLQEPDGQEHRAEAGPERRIDAPTPQ